MMSASKWNHRVKEKKNLITSNSAGTKDGAGDGELVGATSKRAGTLQLLVGSG